MVPEDTDVTGQHPDSAPPAVSDAHAADREFVQRLVAGDTAAWQAFVERYAGLIYSVVRRTLHTRDRDEIRSVLADILIGLRRTKLRTYAGRAALSTWLTLVARSETVDHLRRRIGRGRVARALEKLAPAERTLFRMYYVEGRSPRDVVAELAKGGESWTLERFIAASRAVEQRLGDPWMRRLAYDLHAQSVGAASGRMLEYLDHVRDEFEHRSGSYSPEYHLMEREARRTAEYLTEVIAALRPDERRLLRLRFEEGWTAPEIARELGLDSPRGVYSITDRILRKLRKLLKARKQESS